MENKRYDRAKQFVPFDPLKGFREALKEKERVLVEKKELSEEKLEELNNIINSLNTKDMLDIIYYENGEYIKLNGILTKIDFYKNTLTIVNKKIAFDDIISIELN